jgi:hypothetical protein
MNKNLIDIKNGTTKNPEALLFALHLIKDGKRNRFFDLVDAIASAVNLALRDKERAHELIEWKDTVWLIRARLNDIGCTEFDSVLRSLQLEIPELTWKET